MAKTNNLQDYLKDLYAGISSRKADASKNPQDFRQEIENLVFTGDADAAAADIRLNKTAYVNDVKLTGTIEDYDGSIYIGSTPYVLEEGTHPILTNIEEIYTDPDITEKEEPYYSITVYEQGTAYNGAIYFIPAKVNSADGDAAKKYIYRFHFIVPEAAVGSSVAIHVFRSNSSASTDAGTFTLGALNEEVTLTSGGSHTLDIKDTTRRVSFADLPAGHHFIDVKLTDVNNNWTESQRNARMLWDVFIPAE